MELWQEKRTFHFPSRTDDGSAFCKIQRKTPAHAVYHQERRKAKFEKASNIWHSKTLKPQIYFHSFATFKVMISFLALACYSSFFAQTNIYVPKVFQTAGIQHYNHNVFTYSEKQMNAPISGEVRHHLGSHMMCLVLARSWCLFWCIFKLIRMQVSCGQRSLTSLSAPHASFFQNFAFAIPKLICFWVREVTNFILWLH